MLFREIFLPEYLPGNLYLHSMPGRHEPFDIAIHWIEKLGIDYVICLCPDKEIQLISPDYYSYIQNTEIVKNWNLLKLPIQNFQSPENYSEFLEIIKILAMYLNSSKKLLLHCAQGKGRTGTISIVLLMCNGISKKEAYKILKTKHAGPEREEQKEFIDWCERVLIEKKD
jgi:protein-tyrosine phosphatase